MGLFIQVTLLALRQGQCDRKNREHCRNTIARFLFRGAAATAAQIFIPLLFIFRFFFNPCRHRPEHSYELFAQLLASVLPLPWRYGTACTLETSPPPPPIVKTLKWLTLLHTLTKSHSGWGQRSIRHSLPFPQLWDVPRQYLSAVSSPLDMF